MQLEKTYINICILHNEKTRKNFNFFQALICLKITVDIGVIKSYNRLVNFFMKAGFLNEKR